MEISPILSARELMRWVIFLEKKGSMIYKPETKKSVDLPRKKTGYRSRTWQPYPTELNDGAFEGGDEPLVFHVKVKDVVDEPLLRGLFHDGRQGPAVRREGRVEVRVLPKHMH